MTVGTGFFGRSALTENLEPRHLTQWTRLAYATDGAVRRLRRAAAVVGAARSPRRCRVPEPATAGDLSREDLRRMILDELRRAGGR